MRLSLLVGALMSSASGCSDDGKNQGDTTRTDDVAAHDTSAELDATESTDTTTDSDAVDSAVDVVETGTLSDATESEVDGAGDAEPGPEVVDIATDIEVPAFIVGDAVALVGAGFSFGECVSACNGTLRFEGATLAFEVIDSDGTPTHRATGILTTTAAGGLDNVLAALVGKSVQYRYGCPDCNDGGADWLELAWNDETFRVTYEHGSPPGLLVDVHAIVRDAIDALRSCTSNTTALASTPCPTEDP